VVRVALEPLACKRGKFQAKVAILTWCNHKKFKLLLKGIKDGETGESLCSHVWIDRTDKLMKFGLRPNDNIAFEATVQPYKKATGEVDYHFARLRNVQII
jgi:hypothetical protein